MTELHKSFMRRLAGSLLERKVGRAYVEEFLGDLDEMYEDRRAAKGKLVAEAMYWVDAIHLVLGFSSTAQKSPSPIFLGNMVKVAWRSALRHRQFTVLNLLGLTLGIATCFAIGLYVYDECTYDTFHTNADRIYRINQPMIWGDWNDQMGTTGPGVAEAIRAEISDFEQITRILNVGEYVMRATINGTDTYFNETEYYVAEDNFFSVFSFPFLSGDPKTALREPNSIVITESTARRYFGDADPMGKVIEVKAPGGTFEPFVITGVLVDIPTRSHLQFDMLGSLVSIEQFRNGKDTWIWTIF